MRIESINMFVEIERLAEGFPWEEVQLTIYRKPEGEVRFLAYIPSDSEKGIDSVMGWGENPAEAVSQALEKAPKHDPEICRAKLVTDLEAKLVKLKAIKFDLPPYRPNRELAMGSLNVSETVNV